VSFARTATILLSGLAILVDAAVLVTHMRTVQWLRTHGGTQFPLVEPLIFLPLLGLAGAAWLLLKRHDWIAAAMAGLSLALALLLWISQGAGAAG
jgi:hypothetical protein